MDKIREDEYLAEIKLSKSKKGLSGLSKKFASLGGALFNVAGDLAEDLAGGAGHLLGVHKKKVK